MSNRSCYLPLLSFLLIAPFSSPAAQVASVVEVLASPNPVVQGQYIDFATSVTAATSASPTGTITLTDSVSCGGGATPATLGTISLSPASSPNPGSGNLSISFSCPGAHSILASYGGDSNYSPNPSTPVTITVLSHFTSTTVNLASTQNPDQSITFNARVTYALTQNTSPTGTVTFTDLNTGNVLNVSKVLTSSGGRGAPSTTGASFTASSLTAGTYAVRATYSGDNIYSRNLSNTVTAQGTSAPAPPSVSNIISAGGFGQFAAIAPGTWVEIYGSNLAAKTRAWTMADFNNGNAPKSLELTSVTIGGQPAFISYISPDQVNVQAPSNLASASQQVVVTTAVGSSAPFPVTVNQVEPGLLALPSFNFGSQQYAVTLFGDGSFVLPPAAIAGVNSRRARPGDEIVFYGIGFGPVIPDVPAGQIVQQQNALAAGTPQFSFGSTPATVIYFGLAPGEMGVYQFNVIVPNIAPSDLVPVTFTTGNVASTQTLYIAVGN